jgi:hypothetical protein
MVYPTVNFGGKYLAAEALIVGQTIVFYGLPHKP